MQEQATEIRERNMLKIDGKIYQVIERNISGTGKSGKTIHFKLKSVEDAGSAERRFRAEEKVERVDVTRHLMEFLYKDGEDFVFMDESTYEQFTLRAHLVGPVASFLKENTKIDVSFYEEKPIHINFPKSIEMRVASAPAGSGAGDSTYKEVELENGLKILAPHFIKEGDLVRVDTEHKKYLERVLEDKK